MMDTLRGLQFCWSVKPVLSAWILSRKSLKSRTKSGRNTAKRRGKSGEGNRLSMARLLQFLAYFPATLVLLYVKTSEALVIYLGAFVLNSIGSKVADKIGAKNAVVTDESEDGGNDSGDADGGISPALNKRKLGGKRKG
jgi:hypothetical protein